MTEVRHSGIADLNTKESNDTLMDSQLFASVNSKDLFIGQNVGNEKWEVSSETHFM